MKRMIFVFCLLAIASPASGKDPFSNAPFHLLAFRPKPGSTQNPHTFSLSPEVTLDAKDGSIRLARSVLLSDEMGETDNHQADSLNDRVWAKKVFSLVGAEATEAELFFLGNAARIEVNGHSLDWVERLPSTGWSRARVPTDKLRQGENEFVFSGKGRLAFQPGLKTGRSSKSMDAGRSWSDRALSAAGDKAGEYLVRLRLGRYPTRGTAMTPVIDLWGPRQRVGTPGLTRFADQRFDELESQPAGTRVECWARTGATTVPESKTWTDWVRVTRRSKPDPNAASNRWVQFRFDLTSERPGETPRIPAEFAFFFERTVDSEVAKIIDDDPISVVSPPQLPRVSSVPFTYQAPTPRLKLLRDRYQLDKVIAAGKTEMEQLMLLRWWIRNQWHTGWEGGPAAWMPPWDAHIILENKDQSDCLTMCTHYSAVFTQCCLALGWNARHCILDHHCVSEVWVDQHQKWVMMDTGNSKPRPDCGLHFERDGVPLSALELHLAYRDKKTDSIQVCFTPKELAAKIADLCRPAPKPLPERPDTIPLAELPNYKVCQIENYRRYAFPDRNTYLTSLLPGELYQGYSAYAYDGYWWIGDNRDKPTISPEYSRHLDPARPQDIDWSLNWTRIHLARTEKPGELRVDLETFTPNLARLERQDEKGNWQPTPASFVWKLEAGKNALAVRSVNKFDRAGNAARVTVEAAK